MKKILVVAAGDAKHMQKNIRCTLTAAKQLGREIDLLLVGSSAKPWAEKMACFSGVTRVLVNPHACYDSLAENISQLVASLACDYEFIVAPANNISKDFLPRVAAQINVNQISDVVRIIDAHTFVRPIYAGNALATVVTKDPIKLLTIRFSAFAESSADSDPVPIVILDQIFADNRVRVLQQTASDVTRPTLNNARVVVSGGRALQSAAQFEQIIFPLAEKLNAAVGASRVAVDAKYVANECQVGQTGKVVAPELYFAIGISGAPQHLAGIKDSKVIVAINQDPDAPIVSSADYALIGDLFELVPELTKQLEKESKK